MQFSILVFLIVSSLLLLYDCRIDVIDAKAKHESSSTSSAIQNSTIISLFDDNEKEDNVYRKFFFPGRFPQFITDIRSERMGRVISIDTSEDNSSASSSKQSTELSTDKATKRYKLKLTSDQSTELSTYLRTLNEHLKATNAKNIPNYVYHLERLLPKQWLDGYVIDEYLEILRRRAGVLNLKVGIFESGLYQHIDGLYQHIEESAGEEVVWFKKDNKVIYGQPFETMEIIIIPCGLGAHWVLVVVQITKKKILYLDSLWQNNTHNLETFNRVLHKLIIPRGEIVIGDINKFGDIKEIKNWDCELLKVAQQTNTNDCGVHALMNADFLCDNLCPLESYQLTSSRSTVEDVINYFRQKIAIDLLSNNVDY